MMTRSLRAVGAACLAFTLGAATAAQAQTAKAPDAPQSARVTDEALLKKLKETLVDAQYLGKDFDDIIEDLRERFELNIHVSWKVLEALGIRRDQRLEVRLKRVSLATLLDMILREAAPTPAELAYAVEGGVLVISTQDALVRKTVVRTYDITDLIESGYALRRFGNTPVLSLDLTGREFVGGEERTAPGGGGGFGGGGGGRGGGGGGIFGEPGEDPQWLRSMERIQELVDLIQENVNPETWRDFGGATGTLQVINNLLLIRQTIEAHAEIKVFLELIRRSAPMPLDADVIVVRMRMSKAQALRQKIGDRFPRLTAQEVRNLAAGGDDHDVLFCATTSGFNGQRIWFSALTQRDVLTSMTAHTADQVSAFAPVTGFATEGLELIVLPLLDADGEHITLDVEMAWIPTADIKERAVALGIGEPNASIDQSQRTMRTVSTTARLGLEQGIALSIPHQLDDHGQRVEYEDWLVLYVRAPAGLPPARAEAAVVAAR